ncbi:MAG: TonB-dependent receptor [Candidatus Brocadia sp.]|nr:TonB-dependent receptor [Candidatus Brocadia sp.]
MTGWAKKPTISTYPCITILLLCLIFFHSSEIFAQGTDTSQISIRKTDVPNKTIPSAEEKHADNMKAALAEEISTEAIWFGYRGEVTIATRLETPVNKAPSIVTVITDEEIKSLGYRTFVEILRTVPGFEILKEAGTGVVEPAVRGIASASKVKVMLNGHTVNTTATGSAFGRFDDFPVENIKKLEIIRGPGSAMYGENAFSAVINIITKDAADIDGVRISSGYGSFDTYEENVVFGERVGKVEVSGMAHYRQTTGFDGEVESDFQTIFDSYFGSNASLAPGRVHDGRQEYDLNLKIAYEGLWLQGWYSNKNRDPFIGGNLALNNESNIENNYVFGEIGYKKTFEERFTLRPRIYYDQFDSNSYFEALPEGTVLPADTDGNGVPEFAVFPDGVINVVKGIERVAGTEIPFDYQVFDGNTLTLGFEYRLINQSNNYFLSNMDPVTGAPLPSVQDFSDSAPFLEDATRRIMSVYFQNVWDITDTLNLTVGVRYDQYSDFGDATSPRAGLTWIFMKDASVKFLYGKAFRAPSFYEMFRGGSGNKDLDPETIMTYEVELSYKFNKHVTSRVSYFYNNIDDLIFLKRGQDTPVYENLTDAHVQGVEMETRVDIIKDNYVFMNYTFQNPEDNHGNDMPFVAQHHGNFGVNVHYPKYINTNLSAFVSGTRSRVDDDTRDNLPAYALLNLSVIGKEFFKTLEIQGTVFNMLDKDYSDPGAIFIPKDLPRPGRTYFVGLSYQF